LGWVVVRP